MRQKNNKALVDTRQTVVLPILTALLEILSDVATV